jgi:hypothetical protein
MKIKHIEAQVDVCCKSGRNYRMPQSDFNELKEHIAPVAAVSAIEWNSCLPAGWELRFNSFNSGKWHVFTDEGTHNGGFNSPWEAIAGTMKTYRTMMKTYRTMWKATLDG